MSLGLEHRLPAEEIQERRGHVQHDVPDCPDAAGPNPIRGLFHVGGVIEAIGGHQGPAGLVYQPHEFPRLASLGGHRLLDEHVASSAEGRRGMLEVQHVRRGDDHAVRVPVVHLEVVLGDVRKVKMGAHALQLRRSQPAGRHELRMRIELHVGDVVLAGPPSRPDYGDARLLPHPCRPELPRFAEQSSVFVPRNRADGSSNETGGGPVHWEGSAGVRARIHGDDFDFRRCPAVFRLTTSRSVSPGTTVAGGARCAHGRSTTRAASYFPASAKVGATR